MSESEDDNSLAAREENSSHRHSDKVPRIHAVRHQVWEAPLPPPSLLREYNEAFPGCAERIVAMAEAEGKERHEANRHQRESLRIIINGDVYSQKTGLVLAFVLALVVIFIGAFLLYTGKLALGTGLITVPLLSLVGLFIYGRSSQSRDLRKIDSDDLEEDDIQPSLPFPRT